MSSEVYIGGRKNGYTSIEGMNKDISINYSNEH